MGLENIYVNFSFIFSWNPVNFLDIIRKIVIYFGCN